MSSVTFNNLVLADGQQHRLLFHLKGMQQQGPGGVELHLDCRLVETVRDLPAAFQGLPAGYGLVELRTMQSRDQVTFDSQCFHTALGVRTDGSRLFPTGQFGRAEAAGRGLLRERRLAAGLPLPTKRLCANPG